MKIFAVILFFPLFASAAPRMDSAVGSETAQLVTILPDHEDPNLYYVFPQSSEVLRKSDGRQDFTYIETRKYRPWGIRVESAELAIGMRLSYETDALKQKIAEIRSSNKSAKFTAVTGFNTSVEGHQYVNQYFLDSDCPMIAGPLEVPVYCNIRIKPEMSFGFRQLIIGTQARVLSYIYHFYGFSNGSMNEYAFSVPLKVGSLDHSPYFFDQFGHPLEEEI